MKRLLGVDIFRHILAIFVIMQHMRSDAHYSYALNVRIDNISHYVGWAVMGFFVISGFFYHTPANLYSFIKKQFVRLLLPFFFFSIVYGIVLFLMKKITITEIVIRMITFEGTSMQLYFVSYLFFITVIYSTICYLFTMKMDVSRLWMVDVFLTFILLVTCFFVHSDKSTGPGFDMFVLYSFCFLFSRVISSLSKLSLFFIMLFFFVYSFFLSGRFLDFDLALTSFLFFYLISFYLKSQKLPGSGGVYLLHTPIFTFIIPFFLLKIGIGEFKNYLLALFIIYIVTLFFTLVFINFFARYKWILLE